MHRWAKLGRLTCRPDVCGWLRLRKLLIAAIFLLPLVAVASPYQTQPTGTQPPKRVLILYSFEKEDDLFLGFDQTLRSKLESELPGRVEFYTQYLDLVRFPGPEYARNVVEEIKLRLSQEKPNVIVPVSYAALKFILNHGKDLFPGTPIISPFDARRVADLKSALAKSPVGESVTGVGVVDEPTKTIDLILKLQPDTQKIVVVAGTSDLEQRWLNTIRQEFSPYAGRVHFDYVTGLPLPGILDRVAHLPPHTVIFISLFLKDSNGQFFVPQETVQRIARAANVPVYGSYLNYLGRGVVGGNMGDPAAVAAEIADLALRALQGEDPAKIPFLTDHSARDRIDWRELERWHISKSRVPSGAVLLFRQPTLWERDRGYLIGAAVLLFLESLLIIGLLLQRRRRRAVEQQLQKEQRLSEAVIQSLPGVFYLFGQNRRMLEWNQNLETVTGYSAKEISAMDVFDLIAEADRPKMNQAMMQVFNTGGTSVEGHLATKEGRLVPYYFAAVRVNLGGEVCLTGIGIDISEQKETERHLAENERRFRTIFNDSAVPMTITSPEGIVQQVNRAFEQFLGYGMEELNGKHISTLIHPEYIAETRAAIGDVIAGRAPFLRQEKRYLHKAGHICWGYVSARLVRDEKGAPSYFIAQVIDITERKKAETALRESQRRQQVLLQQVPAIVWTVDPGLRFTSGLGAGLKDLGLHAGELIGMDLYTYFRTSDPKFPPIAAHREALRGNPSSYSFRWDGRAYETHVEPLRNSEGNITGVIGVALDITAREKAEEALRTAEDKFSKAFRNNPEGMTISTLEEGRFIDANDAFLKMLEYQPSELIGRTISELNIWGNLEDRQTLLEKLKAEHSIRNENTTFRTKSAKIRQIQLSAEIIPLAGETCLLAVMRDVTEQKTLEEQFRQAQKMEAVGRLAGGIAHDFNNLVAVILGYSEFIGSEVPADSPVQRYLEPIQKAAKSAAGLTSQLLAFSRRQVLQPKVLNLNTTISEAERMLRRLLGEDIAVSIMADSSLGNVNADPGHILQVLLNLAVNARDAMPNGGKLTIATANIEFKEGAMIDGVSIRPGAYVKLTVRDTGIGMDPEISSRIFEPFFTTKPAGKGTGLGLATVYGIIKQSEGYIFVHSAPGRGTNFDIFLPRVFGRVEKAAEKPSGAEQPAGSGTVLLVEDEPLVRDLLDETLKNAGYGVIVAENGAQALEAAGRHKGNIDLLLTDVIMPEMNGPDLASWLLSARPGMKVLYMSGYTDDKLGPLDTAEPGVPILQKPFGREELLEKVRLVMHQASGELSHNRRH